MWKRMPLIVAVIICGCNRGLPEVPSDTQTILSSIEHTPTDEESVADAILQYVLTSKELESECEFYGTAGNKEIVLISGRDLSWPSCDYPSLAGYTLHRKWHEGLSGPDQVKCLGVRLDKLDLAYKPTGKAFFDSGIEISVQNAGGSKNGQVIGGCTVYLDSRKVDSHWVVEFGGKLD